MSSDFLIYFPQTYVTRGTRPGTKFKTLSRWMYEDVKEALFPFRNADSGATFVVTTALFNFIEICGLFLIGQHRNGRETTAQERFDAFFDYLGPEYKKLRESFPNPKTVYDELRCGMVHEGLIKNKDFTIVGLSRRWTDDGLRGSMTPLYILFKNGQPLPVECGVVYNGSWIVMVGKLLINFQDAIQKFIRGIEDGTENRANFFAAANHIKLSRFKVESI